MEERQGVSSRFKVVSESNFLKGVDFDGEGLILEVVGMDKIVASDPKFGIKNEYGAGGVVTKENWFITNDLLEEGETFRYTFKQAGVEKTFDQSSVGFYFAFTNKDPKAGEIVSIKRTKKSNTDVKWDIEFVTDGPVVAVEDEPKELDGIPF